MATLQASTSYKHRLTWVKYGGVAISRDSYFQSNKFTWNQMQQGKRTPWRWRLVRHGCNLLCRAVFSFCSLEEEPRYTGVQRFA